MFLIFFSPLLIGRLVIKTALITATLTARAAGACNLFCAENVTCTASAAEALACLQDIPFSTEFALQTLDVLTTSLQNFGFGALYHETGPPYSLSIDIQAELAATKAAVLDNTFSTDMQFQVLLTKQTQT